MDLNDPRRRLVVARQANPSIRVSVAPPPTSKPQVVVGPAPNVQKDLSVTRGPAYVAPQRPSAADTLRKVTVDYGQGVAGTLSEIGRQTVQGSDDLVSLLSRAVSSDAEDKKITARREERKKAIDSFFPKQTNEQVKVAGELGAYASPIAVGNKINAAVKGTGLISNLANGGKFAKAAAWVAPKAAESVSSSLVASGMFNDPSKSFARETAENVGIDAAVQAAGGIFGKISKFGNKLLGKGKSAGVVKDIAKTTDPTAIQNVLGVDNEVAQFLASETDPKTITEVLKTIDVDPNITLSPQVRQLLQDEGITKVEQSDTPYGAEYQDGTIRFKDQSFATDENAYHELGHHIFSTKLTPDEQALFASVNGPARAQAVGRAGYTESDLISEDFSDMLRKALTGKIDEIPEELRPIIQKYAKVAAQEAPQAVTPAGKVAVEKPKSFAPLDKTTTDKIGELTQRANSTPIPDGHVRLYQTADDVNSKSDQFFKDPEYLSNYINGRADNATLDFKDVPADQVDSVPGKPDVFKIKEAAAEQSGTAETLPAEDVAAIKEAGGQVPDQVGEVVNKNADEAPAADAPQATEEVTGGIKFRDPATKKQFTRTLEDVQAELETLKSAETPDAKRIKYLETKINKHRSENAKFAFPDADPDVQTEIQKVMDELKGASRQYNKAEKARGQERAARISKGEGAYETVGGGEAGFQAKLGSLKGGMTKSGYQPITADATTQTKILDDIEKSNLRPFEKLNTQNAIRKIWGANPDKPTKADINYIRKYFGDDLADAVDQAVADSPKSWKDKLTDIAGIPRAAMASFDFSMGLRQGGQVAASHFPTWAKANKESVKYATNSKYFESEMKKLADDDAFAAINDLMGVRLPAVYGESDEVMASAHLLEKIPNKVLPGYAAGIKASDRAYSGGLTRLRFDLAKKWVDAAGGVDEFEKKFSKQEIKDLGEVINTSTGSGGKPGGLTEKHMQTLATTLFAPRLWASRLNVINPAYYVRLTGPARKEAATNLASFAAAASSVVGLAALGGADIETDPRSSDFMKIKVGNTRYDVFGGLQQNLVFFTRQFTGEKKNSSSGEIEKAGAEFGDKTRFDLGVDMLVNKLNPLLAYAVKLAKQGPDGTDEYGQKAEPLLDFLGLFTPLNIQSTLETMDDQGSMTDVANAAKSTAMNLPGMVGISVQTYGNSKTKDTAEDGTFKGEVTNDMITSGGKVMLDDKGKPVKVKIPEGATELEIKALKDDKKKSAKAAEYRRGLSTEDQALLKLDEKELKNYLNEGDIDQEKFDSLMDVKQKIKNLDGVEVDENVKSDNARSFYEKYNSLNEKQQKAWLESEPTTNSKSIAKSVNEQRSEGLSEFKPSQKLAKLYAEYEKDANSHPEYTEIDKRNKAKEFQLAARKLNEKDSVNDVFNEGGSTDLKTLYSEGKVAKEDIDAAIKMDDELFNSGVTGELKFSKKFRNFYGYGVPAGPKGAGGSGAGSGGSGSSKQGNAHLANFLVNVEGTGTKAVPQFSARARTAGKFKAPAGAKPGNSSSTVSVAPYNTKSVSQLRRSI